MLEVGKIYNGDIELLLTKVPNGSVDLIIADPPYGLKKSFGTEKVWDGNSEWLEWTKNWIKEITKKLKPTGSIFIYGIHRNICHIHVFLEELGLKYKRQIIWYYENNWSTYTKAPAAHYEPILWFTVSNKYTYHPIREPYKSTDRLKYKITKKGKIWQPNPEGRMVGDVWKFPTLAGRRFKDEKVEHPTQKPLNLTNRIVKHFSNEGDLILVPFAGSGTECVSAILNKRHFIGFEINMDYIKIAERRLAEAQIAFI
jgi:site-specific DNA-methyltransferase (adenine-specific)